MLTGLRSGGVFLALTCVALGLTIPLCGRRVLYCAAVR